MVTDVHVRAKMFDFTPGRELPSLPGFKRDVLSGLDMANVNEWMSKLKVKWADQ